MDVEHLPEAGGAPAVQTFLFVDIRGYTRYIVEQGDAAGARLVERFEAIARHAVSSRHGQVIGTAGDEAVAVFGSAREALRAAVELQAELVQASRDDPTVPLEAGVGLDTGEAVRAGDTFIGAALNLAARLCKLAGPREVLASEGVVHVARKLEGISYLERGLVQLKGFQEPVRVFRVLGEETPEVAGAPAGPAGVERPKAETALPIGGFLGALPSTELVAREPELRRAMAAVDAVGTGSGRLVLLAGEPGVGKTRLAQEVMLSLRNRQFLVATGRCYQPHQSVPFYPFLDALTVVCTAAPPELRAALSSRWPYLCRLLPEFQHETGPATASTPEEQQRLFREVTSFLQSVAAKLPLAILLDDLHWADGASLELLQHLARHTHADRILLVGTYRDVEVGRHHPLEAALRDLLREDLVERIPVRRFERDGTSKLIGATLGEAEVSPELASVVHQHADGNPFFTQQLVRFLVERGDVFQKDGRWVERSLRRVEVPESIRSVIGQRMERLGAGTQEVLREAAVLGQTFSFDALVQLAARPEAEVEAALDEARSTGLLEERQTDRYAFDHALTQQALYSELSSRKRRKLHLAAAEALERLPEPARAPLSAELAWHFLEAAEEERAIPFALAAGDRARAVFAQREAERQYTTVLEIAEHIQNVAGEVEALSRRARLRLDMFRGKDALEDFERLLEVARRRGDLALELRARLGLGESSYIVGLDETSRDVVSQCREMVEGASALADRLGDPRAKVEALLASRWVGTFARRYEDQIATNLKQAREISQHLRDEELLLRCELASWPEGTRAQAEETGARLVGLLEARHDFFRLNSLYFSMMWSYLAWADYDRAIEACDTATRVAEEIGVPPVQYPTLKAFALLRLGRYGEAAGSLENEVVDAEHPFGQAFQSLGRTMYLLELRSFDRAAVAAREVLDRARRLRRDWMTHRGAVLLARSWLGARTLDQAGWHEVEERLRSVDSTIPRALNAEHLLGEGRAEEALAEATARVAEARAGEDISDLLDAQLLELRALVALGRWKEAVEQAERTRARAEPLGALPIVWQVLALKARALSNLGDARGSSTARAAAASLVRRLAESIPEPDLKAGFLSDPEVRAALGASNGDGPPAPPGARRRA